MEAFMIRTGFYDVVLRNEADEWREGREEREGFAVRVAQALQGKGVEVPEALRQQQQHQEQQQALQQRLQLAAKRQQQQQG